MTASVLTSPRSSGSSPPCVLEQDDRLARRLERQRLVLGVLVTRSARSGSTYGCSNSPARNFARSTRATERSIADSGTRPLFTSADELGKAVRVGQLEVDAGLERLRAGVGLVDARRGGGSAAARCRSSRTRPGR